MNYIKSVSFLIILCFSACNPIDNYGAQKISDFRAKCISDNAKFFIADNHDRLPSKYHVCQYKTYHHILVINMSQIHYAEGEYE